MRTFQLRAATLAAATAALALGLTACGGAGSAGDSGAKGTKSSPAYTAKDASGTDTGVAAANSGKVTNAHAAGTRQCDGDEMSYSVLHRFPKQQGEHLLITARNADSKPCWVTSYPSVILGNTSNVLPHSKKDAPGGNTRITVRPGGKVYSAVALFTDSAKTHTSSKLSLAMRDGTGDTGPATEQEAFNSKGKPSKFTWSDADVLNWNTAKPYDF
ncbi:DUF4232 domain-containing protein [Streptomyces sp. NPDC000151]|uniref:DUF4232 domain-containing protein n=1 Tax=Streptomyces sp. NPDC000151 TaxID=3154244 RepID=UPI00331DE392